MGCCNHWTSAFLHSSLKTTQYPLKKKKKKKKGRRRVKKEEQKKE
jgi:hypothetical protein